MKEMKMFAMIFTGFFDPGPEDPPATVIILYKSLTVDKKKDLEYLNLFHVFLTINSITFIDILVKTLTFLNLF